MGHSLKIHSHLSTPSLFSPLFQTCSCSCSFSLSRLLFLTAPSLKCLVVSKVTCHRRSRIRLSSPVCCVFIQTQTTCWANERCRVTTKYYYTHENVSLYPGTLEHLFWSSHWVVSQAQTPHSQMSPPAVISGVHNLTSYLWPNPFLACSSGDSKFSVFSRAFLAAGFVQFCQN